MAFEDMWTAITITESWAAMAQDPGSEPGSGPNGFAWSKAPHIIAIHSALNDRVGHSGASMAGTMRVMQRLAKIGWTTFVSEYNN